MRVTYLQFSNDKRAMSSIHLNKDSASGGALAGARVHRGSHLCLVCDLSRDQLALSHVYVKQISTFQYEQHSWVRSCRMIVISAHKLEMLRFTLLRFLPPFIFLRLLHFLLDCCFGPLAEIRRRHM